MISRVTVITFSMHLLYVNIWFGLGLYSKCRFLRLKVVHYWLSWYADIQFVLDDIIIAGLLHITRVGEILLLVSFLCTPVLGLHCDINNSVVHSQRIRSWANYTSPSIFTEVIRSWDGATP